MTATPEEDQTSTTLSPDFDRELQARLHAEAYAVLRHSATEPAFSGEYVDTEEDGTYACRACHLPLFDSETKYHSGSGWPSFYEALPGAVTLHEDRSYGMRRVEARCARCDSHLGHVFPDGPRPTGERYCINSLSLELTEE